MHLQPARAIARRVSQPVEEPGSNALVRNQPEQSTPKVSLLSSVMCLADVQEELQKALDPTSAEQIIAFAVELPRRGCDSGLGEQGTTKCLLINLKRIFLRCLLPWLMH